MGNLLPPFLVRFAYKFAEDSKDIVKNLQLIHSNHLNHELYSEPSFPAPQLYLLSHTLIQTHTTKTNVMFFFHYLCGQ